MAGTQPLEPRSSPPGAFPETPAPNDNQQFSVNPLPAGGASNPVSLSPGEDVPKDISSKGIDDKVKLDEDSYNRPDASATPALKEDPEQQFSVNPLPATGGIGNPVHLEPGEKVPDSSTLTGNTTTSNVKLDEASYNASDASAPSLPAPLSPNSEKEAYGEKAIFGGLGPQTTNMIPESSMGMGKDAPAPMGDESVTPFTSSAGPGSTTAQLAGQVPLENNRGEAGHAAPAIVTESQKDAGVDPEASASPRAVEEKDQVENELHSKVPEAPAASEGTSTTDGAKDSNKGMYGMAAGGLATAGAAAAGYAYSARDKATESTGKDPMSFLPKSVQDSINNMNAKGTTAPAATSEEKPLVEHAPVDESSIPQQTHAGDGIEVPASGATEAAGTTGLDRGIASSVPEEVVHSQKEAGVDPEAAASPVAVEEKSAFEKELLGKVPESTAQGESAPKLESGSGAGAAAAGVGAAGLGAAGLGAAGLASHESGAASAVPEAVTESQKEAHVDPEAAASPEAVQEKSAVESELLNKVPESTATGEPAPEAATASALTETAPTSSSATGAPQLGDPTAGVAALSMDDKPAASGLNAPASDPAVPPTQKEAPASQLAPPVVDDEPRSRDVSPMTKTATNASTQQAPVVTTGVDSAAAPASQAAGKPVGTPRPNVAGGASNSTPQKRQSFMDKVRGTPESGKSEEGGKKKKGLFKRIADKLK